MLLNLLYLSIFALLSPWLVWRSWRTGRYRQNAAAKLLGRVTILKSSAPVAWFHGVSVGEIHLLVTLVAAFRKRHPDWQINLGAYALGSRCKQRFNSLETIANCFVSR